MAQLKNISYIGVFLVIALELFVAYKLNLPEGWPRFAVAALALATFGGFYWYTHRNTK